MSEHAERHDEPVPPPIGGNVEQHFHIVTDDRAREIAREEIASLCGLVLRRLQDDLEVAGGTGNATEIVVARIFGEALADFSRSESEPGPPA